MDKTLFIRIKACQTLPSDLRGHGYIAWLQFKIVYGYDYEFIDVYHLEKNLFYQILKFKKFFKNLHMD